MSLSPTRRLARALENQEEAVVDLLRCAENYSTDNASWDRRNNRKSLFAAARHYAKATDVLTRARGRIAKAEGQHEVSE